VGINDYTRLNGEHIKDLQKLIGDSNVALDEEKREAYSYDEVARTYWEEDYLAEVVLFPETSAHVSSILKYAYDNYIPVTPRGAGTGLSGGAIPVEGGIVISFEKMNRIIEVDQKNLSITVEPGVVTAEITRAAREVDLFYAGDPCSGDASFIGGNVSENAGGNKVVKYGATGASVMALEVVLADGSVHWFGGKRRKDVTGYDLVHLFVGSEGTLGVITKIILKLVPLPGKVVDLLVPFPDSETAIDFVPRIIIEGKVIPSSIEFIDHNSLILAERYLNNTLPYDDAGAHLIIELEGSDPERLADEYERIGDLCMENGALEVFVADNRTMRDKLWKARKCIAEAIMAFYPRYSLEDIVVPTDKIPELLKGTEMICEKYGLKSPNFGHVGDGNVHVNLLFEEEPANWRQILYAALDDLYKLTYGLGGTLSGEHGIGLKRKKNTPLVLDEKIIEITKKIKSVFDPRNILNPGKIVP